MKTIHQDAFDAILSSFRHGPLSTHGINSANPCVIAEALGISYHGDINLEHGGTFYDPSDWTEYGYADACSVSIGDRHLFVTTGTIHRNDVNVALHNADHEGEFKSEYEKLHAEIVACEAWTGIESDYNDTNAAYRITRRLTGNRRDSCRVGQQNIDLDNLQGWFVRTVLAGSVICLD